MYLINISYASVYEIYNYYGRYRESTYYIPLYGQCAKIREY